MIKFLQRIGKSLMLPIACLPIAGLMLRFGQADVIEAFQLISSYKIPMQKEKTLTQILV